jgi:membrane-bound serine protease (ClpP class)
VTSPSFADKRSAPCLTESLQPSRTSRSEESRWYSDRVVDVPLLRGLLVSLATAAIAIVVPAPAGAATPHVLVAELDNDINPVTRDFVVGAIHRAERDGDSALVIELDTPGGLSSSMRSIVKAILAAKVPVVVYVYPPGSSADSAGAVIGQSADVLAMAPQTNIGSSTPISTSGQDFSKDLRRKIVNDAAAYIGELAREHGRNVQLAEQMVRKATNYGARDALRLNVVDVVAPGLAGLMRQLDGRKTIPKQLVLHTAGATVERTHMSFVQRARDLLIDPNIIELMLSIGLIGILVELWHPGLIFPGTVGAVSLIVGLYGLQVLPVSVAGVLLLLLAFAFFAAEPFVMSHGALAVGGGVLFVVGSLILFDPAGPVFRVSLTVTLAIAGTLTVLLGLALARVVRARRLPVEGGASRLVGATGEMRSGGYAFVDGELWRARSADGEQLVPGQPVTVERLDENLELLVVGSRQPTEGD